MPKQVRIRLAKAVEDLKAALVGNYSVFLR